MKKLLLLAAAWTFAAAPLEAATYKIDPAHSAASFRIRHLVGKVSGGFDKMEGEFVYEEGKPDSWKTSATIDAASINTKNEKRDRHLRSADFFDTDKCPTLTFESTKITDVKDNTFKLEGALTMHCVTKPVTLDVEFGGTGKDPWGNLRAGAVATTKLNRKDFGVTYNQTLDTGGLLLGEEVEVTLELEGIAVEKKK